MKKVVIHSDGACHGNPGPGGWAAVLAYGKHCREISGGVLATTNNRMELQAAIEALSVLKERCEVEFHTDSKYLRDGVTKWIHAWKRRGWLRHGKQPVKSKDLWQALDALIQRHAVQWYWVKGHAGDRGNERCDVLATEAIVKMKEQYKPDQIKAALVDFSKEHQGEISDQSDFEASDGRVGRNASTQPSSCGLWDSETIHGENTSR